MKPAHVRAAAGRAVRSLVSFGCAVAGCGRCGRAASGADQHDRRQADQRAGVDRRTGPLPVGDRHGDWEHRRGQRGCGSHNRHWSLGQARIEDDQPDAADSAGGHAPGEARLTHGLARSHGRDEHHYEACQCRGGQDSQRPRSPRRDAAEKIGAAIEQGRSQREDRHHEMLAPACRIAVGSLPAATRGPLLASARGRDMRDKQPYADVCGPATKMIMERCRAFRCRSELPDQVMCDSRPLIEA